MPLIKNQNLKPDLIGDSQQISQPEPQYDGKNIYLKINGEYFKNFL